MNTFIKDTLVGIAVVALLMLIVGMVSGLMWILFSYATH